MSKRDFFKDINEAGLTIQRAHGVFKRLPGDLDKTSPEVYETVYEIIEAFGRAIKDLNKAYRGIEKMNKLFNDGHAGLTKERGAS